MTELGPPEGTDPVAFWERVGELKHEGLPSVTASKIARLEALGLPRENEVRVRAAGEPKLRTHPETAAMRKAVIERAKR